MTEENEDNKPTTRLNFGGRQESAPLHDLGNLSGDPEFEAARTGTDGEATPDNQDNTTSNTENDFNTAAETVPVSTTEGPEVNSENTEVAAPIDGSQADLVSEVSQTLQDQVVGTDASPAVVAQEAPAAVSVEVAAAAAADQAQAAMAAPAAAADDGESIESLRAKQDLINRQLAEKTSAERAAVIEQIKTVVNTYNIPVKELVEALGGMGKQTRQGSKAKAKYRNPADGTEWSGRGREPLWIKGQDRTKFAITE